MKKKNRKKSKAKNIWGMTMEERDLFLEKLRNIHKENSEYDIVEEIELEYE